MKLFLLSVFTVIYSTSGIAAMKKSVEGYDVYFSSMPSVMILSHPKKHTEREMHGGVPKNLRYHLMVTVKHSKTDKRVTVSSVQLTISGMGKEKVAIKLEPMLLNGILGYGKYFKLKGGGPFHAQVVIKLPQHKEPLRTQFDWWNHPIAADKSRNLGGN